MGKEGGREGGLKDQRYWPRLSLLISVGRCQASEFSACGPNKRSKIH